MITPILFLFLLFSSFFLDVCVRVVKTTIVFLKYIELKLKQILLILIKTLINISYRKIYTKYSYSLALSVISIYSYLYRR